jgi:ribosomal-protein-alanine N-acetyltransferase
MTLWSGWPRVFVDELGLAEADALADIHRGAFARTWSEEEFAALLAEAAVFAIGVRRQSLFGGRRLVGFVLVRVAADEAEVLTIAVRAESRGRGYGRLLMEEALRRLYRERVAACFLEVDRDNRVAVALYRSLGFVVAGERKRYYADPQSGDGTALVMRLQVR